MITKTISDRRGRVDVRFGSRGRQSRSGESREHMEIRRKTRWREGGPQLPSFRQGWAGVFICRDQGVGDNIHYAEKRGEVGERKKKCSNLVLLATDTQCRMRRGSPVNDQGGKNE